MHQFDNKKYQNPPAGWQNRNKTIAELLDPNKSVLDLGCGYKNFLKFYNPSKYLGVDNFAEADIVLDLNLPFKLPTNWDYIINSGVLEYLDDVTNYINRISNLGSQFIFSWWQKPNTTRMSYENIEATLLEYYKIEKKINIGQCIYLCRPL